ncbi:MAG: hypothetical protein WCL32_17155 [Planctomycetota bacterium]
MPPLLPAAALKLGLHLEYLRGVSSVAIQTLNDLQMFTYLLENQPALRYTAKNVVAALQSLDRILAAADLPRTQAVAAQFDPLRAEVEEFLRNNPGPNNVHLQDHFAERIVRIAEATLKTLREEM